MTPWFVLSYPRSRTAWLAVFLSGAGVPSIHEGWKYCRTVHDMRRLLESFNAPVVCNSDCANLFFLDDILREFPNARFIRIQNRVETVLRSLQQSPYSQHGDIDCASMMQDYTLAMAYAETHRLTGKTLTIGQWGAAESAALYKAMTGRSAPAIWVEMMEGLNVEVNAAQVARDVHRAQNGELDHVLTAIRGVTTWHL